MLEFAGTNLVQDFDFVSLHARTDVTYANDDSTIALLERLRGLHLRLGLDSVVFHPDVVEDWRLIRESGLPVSVENMDRNKSFGKTAHEVAAIVENNDFRLVLDVNHAYTNDPSLELAAEFRRLLGNRISHVHLSGFQSLHEPLFRTDQPEIVRAVPPEVPIILEGAFGDLSDLTAEIRYVQDQLAGMSSRGDR